MGTPIVVDLTDETKVALEAAAREEGLTPNELIDKALQGYLFIRRFRSLHERMMSDRKPFTDQEVFDLIS